MYTRCPACHTVHPVNAALLAQGNGRYRCGKCNKSANALESLFDDWPQAGDRPHATADLPVLGLSIDLEKARQSRLTPAEAGLSNEDEEDSEAATPRNRKLLRAGWIMAAVALILFVTFSLADIQARRLFEDLGIKSSLVDLGLITPPATPPFRDLISIHLVSRELKNHPLQPDMLLLSATIVNRAAKNQPFPDLEITLFDAVGDPLASHHFVPGDYLAQGSLKGAGMAPQAYLPLTLELPDPGLQAVGFELQFQ